MTSLLARGDRRTTSGRPGPSPDPKRTLLGAALKPTGVTLVLICVAVVVVLVSANSDLAGAVAAVAASWLAVHQVSLTVSGAPLGILPLLPTALLVWAVARECAAAVTPETELRDAGRVIAAAVAGPVAVTLIAFAVIGDAAAVVPLESPNAWSALATVVGIHLVAAIVGIAVVLGRDACARWGAPDWTRAIAVPASRSAGLLFAAGAATVAVSLVWSWSDVGALLDDESGVVGLLGLTVLSVLYLPNVAMGAVAVLVGGVAHAGGATVSLFEIVPGPVPPVPVLGGVPSDMLGPVWPVLLVVPVAVGAFLGRECARYRMTMQETSYAVACAAAGVGVLGALAGALAGGDVGSYGFVGVEPAFLGLITFGWLVVPGLLVAAVAVRRAGEPEVDAAETAETAEQGPAEPADEPVLEIRRLERPTVRYRAAPAAELAAATDDTGAETVEAETGREEAGSETETGPEAETVVEAEIVDEPSAAAVVEDPSGEARTDTTDVLEVDVVPAEKAGDAADADLPDGPATTRD